MLNRRQLIGCALAIPTVSAAGMAQPDWEDARCISLNVRTDISGESKVARAVFGFGAYEELLLRRRRRSSQWHDFMFEGDSHRIRVTNLMVDAGRPYNAVVAIVEGMYA